MNEILKIKQLLHPEKWEAYDSLINDANKRDPSGGLTDSLNILIQNGDPNINLGEVCQGNLKL